MRLIILLTTFSLVVSFSAIASETNTVYLFIKGNVWEKRLSNFIKIEYPEHINSKLVCLLTFNNPDDTSNTGFFHTELSINSEQTTEVVTNSLVSLTWYENSIIRSSSSKSVVVANQFLMRHNWFSYEKKYDLEFVFGTRHMFEKHLIHHLDINEEFGPNILKLKIEGKEEIKIKDIKLNNGLMVNIECSDWYQRGEF